MRWLPSFTLTLARATPRTGEALPGLPMLTRFKEKALSKALARLGGDHSRAAGLRFHA